MKNLTWQNPEQLFVAQELINKVKSKCCGIKVNIKANDELFLERLIKVINENLSNVDFTVENLADEVGISRVQLHRKLKDLIGVSTSEFIRNLRLQQATILLKDNKVNISQIAYAVGFSNPILFSSTFKKTYGCTPREYRERNM